MSVVSESAISPRGNGSARATVDGLSAEPSQSQLSLIPTFSEIDHKDLQLLQARTTMKKIPRGAVLLRQGDPPDKLYLVLSGRFFVIQDGRSEPIAQIGPGEPAGELAFFAGVERTANVVAARDSTVLVLTSEDYSEVTRAIPHIVPSILSAMAKRLARVTSASPAMRPRPPRTVALLPVGSNPHLPGGFARLLANAISTRNAVPICADSLSQIADIADENDLRERLAGLEGEADLLLLAMEHKDTPFARACLSLADQLLLVGHASDSGTSAVKPTKFETWAAGLFLSSDRSLVLVRENAFVPIANTASWIDARDVKLHHHVALKDRRDLARLGRFLTGSALGLVLGGGAALGPAHLGIAKALDEADEPIDFYGGTSVGAAMGAGLAMGVKPDDIVALTEEIFVTNRAMRRVTIPFHSLLDHQTLDASLRAVYAGKDIEDLPQNFFAISASLTENRPHVHRRGSTWESVRASAAIPGVLPPFITKSGDVLVDGAMVDNLPVRYMRDFKIGPNVVVRLSRRNQWRVHADYDAFPTRKTLLRNMLLRRRQRHYPSLASVLIRGMIMTSEQKLESTSTDGDFFLVPRGTERVGFLDWQKARQVADTAYRHFAEMLDKAGGLKLLIESKS